MNTQSEERLARWSVHLVQILFLVIALFGLDGPFLSAHNERQNQSFDMARHVYQDGWRSVITPKVSFVNYGYEQLRYTAALQEVPFNGLILWPLVPVIGHERALTRLVAVAFSLTAIQLLYLILRHWLPPASSAAGTILFALSPLVLHFGQTPMPDIVCTAGILAAFLCALRGKLAASSAGFAFAILAKPSVIVFGLPVLVPLLAHRQCWSFRDILRVAITWGWFPLVCLAGWLIVLVSFAPPTPMSISGILAERGHWSSLVRLAFYEKLFGPLFAFGLGVLGVFGLLFALRGKGPGMDRRIKWAIIISNLVFFVFVFRKVPEPQYLVAVLPWGVIAASFGINYFIGKWHTGIIWRAALGAAMILHIIVALVFTIDLKTSRIPGYANIERAAKLLPPDARVIVVYPYYGASPAIWLDRNVLPMGRLDSLEGFDKLHREGFDYVLLLDVDSWHNLSGNSSLLSMVSRVFHVIPKTPSASATDVATFTGASSPFRQYCDQRLSALFAAPNVVLYSIPATTANTRKP